MTDQTQEEPPEARPVETEVPSDLMAALVAGIEDAAATGKGLACQIRALETNVERAERRRTGLIAAAVAVAALLLAVGAAVALFLQQQADQSARVVTLLEGHEQGRADLARSTDLLRDCLTPGPARTTPPNECYEEDLAARGALIASITTAAGQCVVDRDPDVRACVERIVAGAPPVP